MAGVKLQALFVLICVVAAARCCAGEEAGGTWDDNAELKAEAAEAAASEAAKDASDTASSWADWAYTKISGGRSGNVETTEKIRNLAEKIPTGEQIHHTVSGAAHATADKAHEAKNKVVETLA